MAGLDSIELSNIPTSTTLIMQVGTDLIQVLQVELVYITRQEVPRKFQHLQVPYQTQHIMEVIMPIGQIGVTSNGHGVTEGGSSGSPIFNQSKRIVGQLSGGSSTCNSPNYSDLYGKMSEN